MAVVQVLFPEQYTLQSTLAAGPTKSAEDDSPESFLGWLQALGESLAVSYPNAAAVVEAVLAFEQQRDIDPLLALLPDDEPALYAANVSARFVLCRSAGRVSACS